MFGNVRGTWSPAIVLREDSRTTIGKLAKSMTAAVGVLPGSNQATNVANTRPRIRRPQR